MKKRTNKIWESMPRSEVRQLALAVFFLFATIGPLSLLMDAEIIPASWVRFAFITLLSGAFSASIILFMGKPFRLLFSIVAYAAATIVLATVHIPFLDTDVPSVRLLPGAAVVFDAVQIRDIESKRTFFGITAVFCLSLGYGLFVRSLSRENKRRADVEADVKLAQAIHGSLLPRVPFITEWCEVGGVSLPAAQIGGDFFDVIPVSESQLLVIIADASGHGAGAGILSAMTKSGILQELRHTSAPDQLLASVNATIHAVSRKDMFVTCAAVLFDRKANTASIVTAGHPPVLQYVRKSGTVVQHRAQNLGLGIAASAAYTSLTVPYAPGDLFCLITDGVTDAAGPNGERFGMERTVEHLQSSASLSAAAATGALLEAVRTHTAGAPVEDDVTAALVRML